MSKKVISKTANRNKLSSKIDIRKNKYEEKEEDSYRKKLSSKIDIRKKDDEEEEEEYDDEVDTNLDLEEEITKKKCSLKDHEENYAIIYCQECKIYMCNKCNNHHSQLFKNHKQYNLDNNNIIKLFSDICKKSNHNMKFQYFCEDHNVLCCAACISKIKTNGNGIHKFCNVYSIKKIKNKKKSKLVENIKYLKEMSNTIDKSINELKTIFEKLNKNKEKLKEDIQKVFTKIRNSVNEREDEILLQVDKIYGELFFKEDLIKQSEKLPNKIKASLYKGKIDDNQWEDKDKLNSLIYYSICIENNIKEINIINDNMKKSTSNLDLNIIFKPEGEEINNFIENIKKFGNLDTVKNIDKEIKIKKDDYKAEEMIKLYDNEFSILSVTDENELRQKIIELNYNDEMIREWIENKLAE